MPRPTPRSRRLSKRPRRAAPALALAAFAALASVGLGCLVPWKEYRVLPAVAGRVASTQPLPADARLMLSVRHRENVSLNATRTVALGDDARFAFEPIAMSIAGKEYTKVYRVFLHLHQDEAEPRVIWRADVPRDESEPPIALECLLDRPVALGEACRIRDAARRDWLVAQGEATFRSLCTPCHAAPGEPPRDAAPTAPPDLTRIAALAGGVFDRDAAAHWIEGRSTPAAHGDRRMPIWGERLGQEYARYAEGDELIGAKLDPLLAYLERIQRP